MFDGDTREGVLEALIDSVRVAVNMFEQDYGAFRNLQQNSFRQRFVWSHSAQRYLDEVYKPAAAGRRIQHA